MIWIILIITVILVIIIRFLIDLNKDNKDLKDQNVVEKFQIIVSKLNEYVYQGEGQIEIFDKRQLNLYKTGENKVIQFNYSTGHLTIAWKYASTFFKKPYILPKQFDNVRNIDQSEEKRIADIMIKEIEMVSLSFLKSVLDESELK
jgi:hypothetical protein